jgi:7-carboxy-7-deazaguanine synthase
MTIAEIIAEVKKHNPSHVCLTGGEPLLQPAVHSLMKDLCDAGLFVSLETSGGRSCEKVDPRVKIILDIKTPDSGEPDSFLMENLKVVNELTEIKFVICSEKDFLWAEKFAADNNLFQRFPVLYSPSFGQIDAQWLAEKILLQNSSARLQLQLHKYIWSPNTRGV